MRRVWKPLAIAAAVAVGIIIGRTSVGHADQPHMQNALWMLADARAALAAATPDKAGHRARALELADQAITETREGIAAGAR